MFDVFHCAITALGVSNLEPVERTAFCRLQVGSTLDRLDFTLHDQHVLLREVAS